MKKLLIATAALTLMCGSAFAQGTGPSVQNDNMTRPGTTDGSMDNRSMDNDSMRRGSMNDDRTTGMGNGMSRGSVQPDASGQGGSGPGSDQGGTRVAPNNIR